jgi:hypothetical protein
MSFLGAITKKKFLLIENTIKYSREFPLELTIVINEESLGKSIATGKSFMSLCHTEIIIINYMQVNMEYLLPPEISNQKVAGTKWRASFEIPSPVELKNNFMRIAMEISISLDGSVFSQRLSHILMGTTMDLNS